ncbi:hypothetical protein [Agarilytica rhodophyticola]|uniref:hypothetical protein n=1 Tax=Agarilytica rhodophyticola TaxID=1737490 RepID=UPI0013159221|nr:hypothetical protein [Agarilytica rhodophyticola]
MLITKPGEISSAQKKRLLKNNIEVIESEYPTDVIFKQPDCEFSSSELFSCSMKALKRCIGSDAGGYLLDEMLRVMEEREQNNN